MRSNARRWNGFNCVVTINVSASASADVRYVLRTMVAGPHGASAEVGMAANRHEADQGWLSIARAMGQT